jgi:hypothetical protein
MFKDKLTNRAVKVGILLPKITFLRREQMKRGREGN